MTKREFDKLVALSDAELEQGLRGLLGDSARTEASIVAHLAEVELRRLHLRAGYPSMFQYCLGRLGLSENEAFHRIVVARLAAAFPMISELLEAREIHLSAVCLLRRHLTDENHRELLAEACGKSKRQVEELLARRFPESVAANARAGRFKPISEGCFRLDLYVTKAQKEKFELARDLISHANPSGDWGVVFERAAEALAEKVEGRRFGKVKAARRVGGAIKLNSDDTKELAIEDGSARVSTRGRSSGRAANGGVADDPLKDANARPPAARSLARSTNADRRHIPNLVRRVVAGRDEMSCTFTSETGKRCGARAFVQFDHEHAWARGGPETCENLRILCAAHNRLLAEDEFRECSNRAGHRAA